MFTVAPPFNIHGDGLDYPIPVQDSSKLQLFQVLEQRRVKEESFYYRYDFGDNWEHAITCVARTDPTTKFMCLEGEGHPCTEDCGGLPGWEEIQQAYDAARPTRDQKERMRWFEGAYPDGLRGHRKWQWDKEKVDSALSKLKVTLEAAQDDTPNFVPSILLLSLVDVESVFDGMYSEVMDELRPHAELTEVTNTIDAMRRLSNPENYAAIILTDLQVAHGDFSAVLEKIVEYTNAGGTVIFGFRCGAYVIPSNVNSFLQNTWGLNWKCGHLREDLFHRNPRSNLLAKKLGSSLPRDNFMKAVTLSGVKSEDQVYSSGYKATATESPVIFAKYGEGHLAWIGKVDPEPCTAELSLTMCGL